MFKSLFAKSALALVVSSAIAPASFAQENSTESSAATTAKEIEKISVWSTAVKTSSIYLKGEDIANKQADHISDLLRFIPGVEVGGAHSLNQRITIRAMDDKDLDITIDGATQNTYMYHHMGNLQIHADILKSADIEIGTNSVINGGLGGAVRFETKDARDLLDEDQTIGARVQVSAGDNSGSNYSISAYGLLGDSFDFLGYYNHVDRDNYDVGGDKIEDENGEELPGTDGEVKGLEGEVDDALIKFGWDLSDNQRISLSYERYKDEGDYSYRPDMGLATDIAITESLNVPLLWPTEFTRDTYTFNYDLNWGESSQLKAAIFSNESELWRDETGYAQNPDYVTWAAVVTGEATNTGANVLAETAFDDLWGSSTDHDLTYGFDYIKHETDYQAVYTSAIDKSSEEATTIAIFFEDSINLGHGVTLIPGVRYQDYDIDSTVVDDNFDDVTFALAAEYQVNDTLLFKLSSTELFKGPEIGEVFTGAGLWDTENQDIDAETGVNTEFAFAYQDSLLGADRFAIGATVFNTQIDDYIYDYAESPTGRYWKDNVGDVEIDGYEAYMGYEIGALNTQLTFSSADSELDAASDYESLDGLRLDREQGDTLTASVDYAVEQYNLTMHWEVMHVKDKSDEPSLDGASLSTAKEGYTVNNMSARWLPQGIEGLTVLFGIDNVFDEYYTSQSSRTGVSFHPRFGELYLADYEPGRNIKATLSYEF